MIAELWLVGVGTGSPGHLTQEGADALRAARVVLVPRKGAGKEDLETLRLDLLARTGSAARIVPFDMPLRDESLPYQTRVARWHDAIARAWQAALRDEEGPAALMVWGDPGLYDSTLRIAERLDPRPRLRVLPGITALQALTAAHHIPLNTVDGRVLITTGRKLRAEGWPDGAETVCVMLDGDCSFRSLDQPDLHIWWGAFLGMPEQVLVSGPLPDVAAEIERTRSSARAAHGWIMDTYLLRRGESTLQKA